MRLRLKKPNIKINYRNDGNGGPNIREGLGIFQYKNGDVYVGEFKNNKIDGYGIYRWKNNSVYDGMFKEDQRHGKGVIRYWPRKR